MVVVHNIGQEARGHAVGLEQYDIRQRVVFKDMCSQNLV
jgi:hypothetical protein